MLNKIFKRLVPSGNYNDNQSREKITVFSGFMGIILNVLLFATKFAVGSLFGIVSVTADAFNNLSDCGSSLVSIFSSKLSGKSPDKEHPYGHARIEYIASLCISFIILFLGFSLLYSSFLRILNPEETKLDIRVFIVLVLSVLVKLWMFYFNKKSSKLINSTVLKAVSLDSLSDSIATVAVLVSLLLSPVIGFDLDGFAGIIVAMLILKEGISVIKETLGHIIGSPADKQLTDALTKYILSHTEIISAHDLMIHSYGPNRLFASIHAELDGDMSLREAHSIVDAIEKEASKLFGVEILIHMDPAISETPHVKAIKQLCEKEVNLVWNGLNMHDFQIDKEKISFEVSKPYNMNTEKEQLKTMLEDTLTKKMPGYTFEISVDEIFT